MHVRIVHLIDLARVGGVESMYADFIQADPPAGITVEHITLLEGNGIARRFCETVARGTTVLSSRRLGFLTLPRRPYWVRARHRSRQIRACRPQLVLVWNQFIDFRLKNCHLRCPVVYYEHGMSWYSHSAQQLAGFFPHVAAAIAVSRAAQRVLILKHQVEFPIDVCPNPLRVELLCETLPLRYLPKDRPLRLGLAARLVPLKAVGLLVLAVAELTRLGHTVEAWIAGEGPEQGVIDALIARYDLHQQIRLLGLIDDMASFYRQIDIFVMPSVHETMPLVCIEAMAYGLPVISSNIDGFTELVRHGETGYCLVPSLSVAEYIDLTGASAAFTECVYDPLTDSLIDAYLLRPADIALAVIRLLDDENRYRQMAVQAAIDARVRYDYSIWLKKFYSLLLKNINNPLLQ